jgi:hypothetical protein
VKLSQISSAAAKDNKRGYSERVDEKIELRIGNLSWEKRKSGGEKILRPAGEEKHKVKVKSK